MDSLDHLALSLYYKCENRKKVFFPNSFYAVFCFSSQSSVKYIILLDFHII